MYTMYYNNCNIVVIYTLILLIQLLFIQCIYYNSFCHVYTMYYNNCNIVVIYTFINTIVVYTMYILQFLLS